MRRLLPAAALLLGGCLVPSIEFGYHLDGTPDPVERAADLVEGRTTLPETLAALGPPSLLVNLGETVRAYYLCLETRTIDFSLQAPIPFLRQRRSADAFYFASVNGRIRMARLEFGRAGLLLHRDIIDHERRTYGEAALPVQSTIIDWVFMDGYLEDRARAGMDEPDADE